MSETLRPTIADRDPDELQAWAEGLAPAEDPEAEVEIPVPLDDLALFIAERLPDEELLALPEVQDAIAALPVREDVRGDLISAATGGSLEQEREEGARAQASRENRLAKAQAANREPAQNAP